jgi:hypothetical protein
LFVCLFVCADSKRILLHEKWNAKFEAIRPFMLRGRISCIRIYVRARHTHPRKSKESRYIFRHFRLRTPQIEVISTSSYLLFKSPVHEYSLINELKYLFSELSGLMILIKNEMGLVINRIRSQFNHREKHACRRVDAGGKYVFGSVCTTNDNNATLKILT